MFLIMSQGVASLNSNGPQIVTEKSCSGILAIAIKSHLAISSASY